MLFMPTNIVTSCTVHACSWVCTCMNWAWTKALILHAHESYSHACELMSWLHADEPLKRDQTHQISIHFCKKGRNMVRWLVTITWSHFLTSNSLGGWGLNSYNGSYISLVQNIWNTDFIYRMIMHCSYFDERVENYYSNSSKNTIRSILHNFRVDTLDFFCLIIFAFCRWTFSWTPPHVYSQISLLVAMQIMPCSYKLHAHVSSCPWTGDVKGNI